MGKSAEADRVFQALADPTRRAILALLRERESSTAGEITEGFPEMTRAAVSAHLRVLWNARLVEERRQGKYRVYSLGPNRPDDVVAFLAQVYSASLEDVKTTAEAVDSDG